MIDLSRHFAPPHFRGGVVSENGRLRTGIEKILETAKMLGMQSIAFPPLGVDTETGFPILRSVAILVSALRARNYSGHLDVRIVLPDPEILEIFKLELHESTGRDIIINS